MHTHPATILCRPRPAMLCSGSGVAVVSSQPSKACLLWAVSTGIGKAGNGEQPQKTRHAHGDTSFSFSRARWRFTTSSMVASASAASAATAGTAAAKDVLCIHYGAVDQTTITRHDAAPTGGHEARLPGPRRACHGVQGGERVCVRAKRKAGGSVGLGFSGVLGSNGLEAFTMVGSTASNGVSDCVCACMQFFLIEGAHAGTGGQAWTTCSLEPVSGGPVNAQTVVPRLWPALCARGCRREWHRRSLANGCIPIWSKPSLSTEIPRKMRATKSASQSSLCI